MEEVIATRSFYVYALKDPISSPSLSFHIARGAGVRAWEHESHPDNSLKGQCTQRIKDAGRDLSVVRLVDQLTAEQALRVEAELLRAFGTLATGGLLTDYLSWSILGPLMREGRVRRVEKKRHQAQVR